MGIGSCVRCVALPVRGGSPNERITNFTNVRLWLLRGWLATQRCRFVADGPLISSRPAVTRKYRRDAVRWGMAAQERGQVALWG